MTNTTYIPQVNTIYPPQVNTIYPPQVNTVVAGSTMPQTGTVNVSNVPVITFPTPADPHIDTSDIRIVQPEIREIQLQLDKIEQMVELILEKLEEKERTNA